ncbi:YdcF family protein [Fundicoccus culcitae]|uniref:YdcF family protein n=1 Tax=Fundicoccus culcitae TaxID=2969821 RepID=A0ABY5P792_9LACT|nr:YdcF family protein [Fundicoccus culcitae]UUX34612.1 YdcF family protein [Fundicoccus culcitae]
MKLLNVRTQPVLRDFTGPNNPQLLEPKIGQSFESEPAFHPVLEQLNQWNIKTAVKQLDHIIQNYPDYRIQAIRLKAEVYGTYDYFQSAWEQWDLILADLPTDRQALFLSTIYAHILNSSTHYSERFIQLNKYHPNDAKRLTQLITFIDRFKSNKNLWRTIQSLTTIDAIVVFGKGLKSDGSIPIALEARLQAAKKLSHRHPEAKIIVSGGAVANQYNESEHMAKWFVEHQIDSSTIIREPLAKDTVGNSIESSKIILEEGFKTIVAVSSAIHLPRAWMSLKANPDLLLNQINIAAYAPMEEIKTAITLKEQQLSYTTVLRVSKHFTYADFS